MRKQDAILRIQKMSLVGDGFGDGGGVRQDHDVGLQTLGAMHRHHAHFVAAALHVALDLRAAALDPVQEAFQRRRVRRFIGEGEREEFVDRVAGFVPEPLQKPEALSAHDQRM